MFVAKYSWHILLFLQMSVAKHSPKVSVAHWVVNSALPSSYFAYRCHGCSISMLCALYIYNKVEGLERLIT